VSSTTTVGYLGPKGTYSQLAVLKHFGEDVALKDYSSIDEVFFAVEKKHIDYGVVPVENSTEGAINNTQDCLLDSSLRIVGEEIIPVDHNFLINAGAEASNIRTIASHKQSLAQCRNWIKNNFPGLSQIECSSNAEAATLAQQDSTVAAIAGDMAARIYSLKVAHTGIQDQPHNRTRFLVLSLAETNSTAQDKTSLIIYADNKPGALFRVLEPFDNLRISLTKIETRPSKKEAWEYVFFIDFEGHVKDERVKELFERLDLCTVEVKVLGSYPLAKLA